MKRPRTRSSAEARSTLADCAEPLELDPAESGFPELGPKLVGVGNLALSIASSDGKKRFSQ